MKHFFLLLIVSGVFSSCSRIHTYFTNIARDYNGVLTSENGYHRWYIKDGQPRLQGRRAAFRKHEALCYTSREWLVGAKESYSLIPGSEGETVYSPSCSHVWEQADMTAATVSCTPANSTAPIIFGDYQLNASALYAYPLAALTFIAIDIPLTTLYTVTGGLLVPKNFIPTH